MRHVLALLAALPLAACVTSPPPAPPRQVGEVAANKIWARTDGQRMAGNAALYKKGQTDLRECREQAATGEPNKYMIDVLNACMTQRGYEERDRPS